jgi:hypothetical protein
MLTVEAALAVIAAVGAGEVAAGAMAASAAGIVAVAAGIRSAPPDSLTKG